MAYPTRSLPSTQELPSVRLSALLSLSSLLLTTPTIQTVAGPTDAVAQIYSAIPGARPGTGNLAGFWTYPCGATPKLSVNFGGKDWAINSDDFLIGQASATQCIGAIITLASTPNSIQWIMGDSFLVRFFSSISVHLPVVLMRGIRKTSTPSIDSPRPQSVSQRSPRI